MPPMRSRRPGARAMNTGAARSKNPESTCAATLATKRARSLAHALVLRSAGPGDASAAVMAFRREAVLAQCVDVRGPDERANGFVRKRDPGDVGRYVERSVQA